MKKTFIDYEGTGYFSSVVIDYLKQDPVLRPFYAFEPSAEGITEAARLRSREQRPRQQVSNALLRQHAKLLTEKELPAVHQNIERLSQPQTVTITVAHQPSLFLGPLFFFYKLISVINAAEIMNQLDPEHVYVPVYWMGSEDHDKEEHNHIYLFGKQLTWNTAQQGAFGRMSTSSLRPWIQEIKERLGSAPAAQDLMTALEDAYTKERTIAAATRRFIYHFLGGYGLVVVDGDDTELKKLFAPLIKKELTDQFSYWTLTRSNERFCAHYEPQILPREINLFLLGEDFRSRIVREGASFRLHDRDESFSLTELLTWADQHPERFSPNVVLRPLYQETILPDAAMVGGGAELTYWLQLHEVMKEAGIRPPALLLRNSIMWIDSVHAGRIEKVQLHIHDLFLPTDTIIQKYLEQQMGLVISLQQEMDTVQQIYDAILKKVLDMDGSLKGPLEAERSRTLKGIEQLEDRLRKAAKRKEEAGVLHIKSLKEKLFPSGKLQERHDNFMNLYSRLGREFIEILKREINPFQFQFTVLIEPNGSA